eukprot:1150500-Pelagomonas_calceolata.AAC.2
MDVWMLIEVWNSSLQLSTCSVSRRVGTKLDFCNTGLNPPAPLLQECLQIFCALVAIPTWQQGRCLVLHGIKNSSLWLQYDGQCLAVNVANQPCTQRRLTHGLFGRISPHGRQRQAPLQVET